MGLTLDEWAVLLLGLKIRVRKLECKVIRRIIRYVLVFNIAFMSYINAADHELCNSKLLVLEVAHEGITRIVFADEKINYIVIYPQDIAIAIAELHSSGCVFILP